MRAAVLREVNQPVEVVSDLELADPGPRQVKVRIRATGVCHSDLSGVDGTFPVQVPYVLGHEGAGEVVAVGEGVSTVAVGDHIIVAWIPPCGTCERCLGGEAQLCTAALGRSSVPELRVGGEIVHTFAGGGTGTFAEEIVMPVESAIVIPRDIPWEIASLIGCAVTTGAGAALNAAQVTPGSSVVVFGAGGVGISALQGARIAGAAEIVAVDLVEDKRTLALEFGATHAVHPGELGDLRDTITGGQGFDYAIEAIGNPVTIRSAYDAVRRGGTVCIVGMGRSDQQVQFSAFELMVSEKKLVGSIYGSADVRTEFHRLLRLWRAGRLDLERMISRRIRLEDINDAFDALRDGTVIRQVITL